MHLNFGIGEECKEQLKQIQTLLRYVHMNLYDSLSVEEQIIMQN